MYGAGRRRRASTARASPTTCSDSWACSCRGPARSRRPRALPVDSLADAQPGDLVFFAGSDGSASSPGHVGIYIGNGEMIDAPHTGTSVQVQAGVERGPGRGHPPGAPGGVTSGGSTVMGNVTVPGQYAGTIEQAAASNGIPAALLAALVSHESGFEPTAVSSAGAEGIAQFMPATAAGMGINPDDPTEAINARGQAPRLLHHQVRLLRRCPGRLRRRLVCRRALRGHPPVRRDPGVRPRRALPGRPLRDGGDPSHERRAPQPSRPAPPGLPSPIAPSNAVEQAPEAAGGPGAVPVLHRGPLGPAGGIGP